MRTEVHVHGSIFVCKGVRPSQVDQALRPWLDYLDVDTIADAHSLEREEPGLSFDPKERDAILSKVHTKMVDDALFVWVVHDVAPRAMTKKVKGFVQSRNWFQSLSPVTVEK